MWLLAGVWVLMVREMRLLPNNRVRVHEVGGTGKIAQDQCYRRWRFLQKQGIDTNRRNVRVTYVRAAYLRRVIFPRL